MSVWIDITAPEFWVAKLSSRSNADACDHFFSAPADSGTVYTWDGTQWVPPTILTEAVPVLQYIGDNAAACTGIRVTLKLVAEETLGSGGTTVDDFIVAFDPSAGASNQPEMQFVVQRCQTSDLGTYPADTVIIIEATSDGVCTDFDPYVPNFEAALGGITATHMTADVDHCGPYVVTLSGHVAAHTITMIEAMFVTTPGFWTDFEGTEEL